MNEEATALSLGFKGERTYIQGGDIYDAVTAGIREVDESSYVEHLAFRQFARGDCDLVWHKPDAGKRLVGQGKVSFAGDRRPFWIVESSREAVGRRTFDEESIVQPAVSDGQRITLRVRSAYTPIEEIIALTKRLAYELTPDVEGKWVFGQLDLRSAIADDYQELSIWQKNLIAGKFSVNEIEIDGACVGNIRFIVGDP